MVAPPEVAVAQALKAAFFRHSRRYGSRRLHAELQAEGWGVGRHRLRSLMQEQGLRAIQPRSFVPRTTQSRHRLGYAPNLLLGMALPPAQPKEVLVGERHVLAVAAWRLRLSGDVDRPVCAAGGGVGSLGADAGGLDHRGL